MQTAIPSLELVHTQFELECTGVDDRGDLTRIPGPNGVARLFAARHARGYPAYLRHDPNDSRRKRR